jgi:imidazolonepropionase-like amidohydrolase
MKRWALAALVVLCAHVAQAGTTAIINVNVIPMDTERVLAGQTVVVSDGVIEEIGAVDSVPVPKGSQVIDGTDRFLVPGLTEMHAHVAAADSPNLDRDFSLFVANGVTMVRGMLGGPSHLVLRDDLLDGKVFGPRLITSGPSLNGQSVNGATQARSLVRAQFEAGYDFIKIHPGLRADEFEAIAATANELGIPFAGHVPVAIGVERAMAAGMATIDHLDGYMAAMLPANFDASGGYGGFFDTLLAEQVSPDRIAELAKKTAEAGTWNVPTNVLVEQRIADIPLASLRNREDMKYMPKATLQRWADARQEAMSDRGFTPEIAALAIELRRNLILALHQAGAGLLLGSDAPQVFNVPGFSLHYELQNLVDAGLTPYEALRAGTADAARFLGTNTGTVAEGREADLILLDANPLEDIRNSRRIHGVMLRGDWWSAYDLQQRIDQFRHGASN